MKACYIRPLVYRGYDTLGVNPLANPGRRRDHGLGMGRLPRRTKRSKQGVDVKVSSWSRMAPNTLPAMAKSDGQLRQLGADQDGSARRRLLRRHRARRLRQRQRRQRPEHLHRARRRDLHAAARRRRFSAASRATRSSRSRAISATPSPRPILPREALYIADEVFFVGTAAEVTPVRSVDKIKIGTGRRGPVTAALQQRVLRRRQRRSARHARLADLRLPGRSLAARPAPKKSRRAADKQGPGARARGRAEIGTGVGSNG